MKRFMTRKVLTVGIAAGLTLGIAGAALAFWTTSGTGNGSAGVGAPVGITVNQSTVVSGMYPGDTVTLSGTFPNTNASPVEVASVTATIGTLPTGCVAADFSIGGSAPVGTEIPVGTDVGAWTGLTITMNDTTNNQDTCETTSVPIVYGTT